MTYQWTTKIRYVKGLGPMRSKELTKIGIETVGDLLCRHPLSYIYPGGVSIADAKEGMVVIKAKIKNIMRVPFHPQQVEAFLDDGTGICKAVWYNNPWTLSQFVLGMTATFWGKYKGGVLQQPKWTTVDSSLRDVVGGQYGTHHATIRAALKEVLANVELPEMTNGTNRGEWFKQYHFPANKTAVENTARMLKQDECLQLQLALAERRQGRRRQTVKPMEWGTSEDFTIMGHFSYDFTDDQTEAINAILQDMAGTRGRQAICSPMQRLIHGEVGSGKTAVAFYAAMLAALNGKRTLILCPTTILAQQHYDTLRGMGWDDVDIIVSGHSSGGFWDGKKRTTPGHVDFVANEVYGGGGSDKEGDHHIVIGTHALLNNESLLKSASLVIIDEFQKFGVEQRAKIQQNNPHLLLLSATPIPRTLAASVFGDLDVSTIRQLPIQRGTVVTRWVLPEKREGMYEIIEKELAAGHQAYVVYPRITGPIRPIDGCSGDEDVVSAERGHGELLEQFGYDGWTVDLLTGKDTTDRKANALQRFKQGWTKILVSTIIAEVGLDNPNANVMVVEGADRFGLSQLHQLRGRICRSTDTAFCFLVSETANPTSIARLEVIERCNNGFEIAEHDLRLRGPGEVFSTRQHGLPDLRFASLVDDYDLMVEARDLVASGDVSSGVREMMCIRYDDNLELGETI